jgi:glycine/D-amino acid oxidase-like deaminating enzyme
MIRVDSRPADLGVSGWEAILPPRAPRDALRQDIDCDYLVIGAGFAGLAAVRRLRQLDPRASTVLLEARRIADGPAGRNSGFMIDLPHALASGGYGGADADDQRNIGLNRAAIEFAAEAAREFEFTNEAFARRGKINAAAGPQGQRHNRVYAAHLEKLGEPCRLLDARQMRDICGSDYYRGGLETPGTAIIQPALFVRSLADALATDGLCRLYENSAVEALENQGERWRAVTAGGSVKAARVILAVNGLIETFGFFRRRLMHINLYASMTRALERHEIDALGGSENWGFTPADPIGSTLRRIDGSGGTRLVIRNRCTYEASLRLPADRLAQVRRDHRRTFRARFPMLEQVEMEYTWSGRLCLSRNEAWASGELAPGLFSACCQNGLGTTRGTIAGIAAAELAVNGNEPSLVPGFPARQMPSRLFPEPLMTLGARGVIRFKEWRAGREL